MEERTVIATVEIKTNMTLKMVKSAIKNWEEEWEWATSNQQLRVTQIQLNVIKPKSKKGCVK